ncbi:chromosome segregation SMC family protein, partial [Thermodesulfobacteriota bacterium]
MKIRKMEIFGFKSFMDKANIEFPPGVSAVVGPNGCGKSNIVDALRWVMGEQSVKHLRGKTMEDVIFSGANGKQALNMAEVSLTLENDNGSAPEELKDYTEIMLTRKLFRSGESAYFINKQPCRLKDIHNIFMGTGMGAKTYAVIEQGNVGAITDAGPDERRLFIEEAAGVTRYKTRKNEALRKVHSTNQNLLRVSDIISEISRQMNSLKRQAKKAERYKAFQERIMNLDVLLSLQYYDNYKHKINETEALLRDFKDKDIEQSSKLKQIDAAIEQIKLNRWEKNQEIASQKSQKFESQRKADKVENDLAHLRKDIERLTTEAVELEAAYTNLKEKNDAIASEIAQNEKENSTLTTEIADTTSTLEKEHRTSQSIRDRLHELTQDLETCKARLMDLVAQEAKYKNIYQNAKNNKESLNRRLKRIDEETLAAEN